MLLEVIVAIVSKMEDHHHNHFVLASSCPEKFINIGEIFLNLPFAYFYSPFYWVALEFFVFILFFHFFLG